MPRGVCLGAGTGSAGAYKTSRKGVGHFRLEITGVPSHSGVDFGAGHSAVRELAWQIEQISALTDLDRGTTLNVGVVGGGTQSNVVAAAAWAEIDLRVKTVADAESITRKLEALKAHDPHCSLPAHRRPEPPADGADRGDCGLVCSGEAVGSGIRIVARRSGDGRRIGWELHFGAGDTDAGRHGRGWPRRACGE